MRPYCVSFPSPYQKWNSQPPHAKKSNNRKYSSPLSTSVWMSVLCCCCPRSLCFEYGFMFSPFAILMLFKWVVSVEWDLSLHVTPFSPVCMYCIVYFMGCLVTQALRVHSLRVSRLQVHPVILAHYCVVTHVFGCSLYFLLRVPSLWLSLAMSKARVNSFLPFSFAVD